MQKVVIGKWLINELAAKESGGEFLLYKTEDGRIRIETRMQEETVWLA